MGFHCIVQDAMFKICYCTITPLAIKSGNYVQNISPYCTVESDFFHHLHACYAIGMIFG